MGVGRIHTSELDQFVEEVDRLGFGNKACQDFLSDFSLAYDTAVDEKLDPFSDAYFEQQKTLYSEIAGRELDQKTGEMTPIDVATRIHTANTYGTRDLQFMAKHVRAIQTVMMAAELPPAAEVLDMGCGSGLSSEAFAYAGASVLGVDINPKCVELINGRAQRLGLPIQAVHSTFDEFETERQFDLIFFYECLHHALKTDQVLKRVAAFLKPGGKVAFAGEPIFEQWRHWGIRCDSESVYVARKHGWWESGWTQAFLTECFRRAGLKLAVYRGIGLDGGYVGVAVRESETEAMPALPAELRQSSTGLQVGNHDFFLMDSPFMHTVTGERRDKSIHSTGKFGHVMYGPYARMTAGQWLAVIACEVKQGEVLVDVVTDQGRQMLAQQTFQAPNMGIRLPFHLAQTAEDIEVRVLTDEHTVVRIDSLQLMAA